MQTLDFGEALENLEKAYKLDTSNAPVNFQIGKCIFEMHEDKRVSDKYLRLACDSGLIESYVYYAQILHLEHKFDEAIALFKKYKAIEGSKNVRDNEIYDFIKTSKTAKQMVADSANVVITALRGKVNTKFAERMPFLNADETTMYFSSRKPDSANGEQRIKWLSDDILVSHKVNGHWDEAKKIPELNSFMNDVCAGLSMDGSAMIIHRPDNERGDGDYYFTELKGTKWGVPILMNRDINSFYGERNACLSSNANIMYFSSNRPGGYGGYDLYVVKRLANGKWGRIYNLGPKINTVGNEDTPFIFADDKMLYFSSDGHDGMGGYDIFEAEIISDTSWSRPINLGYPINSVNDDKHFVLAPDRRSAYYSAQKKGGKGSYDIYHIRMPYLHKSLGIIEGYVYSNDTYEPLKAVIRVYKNDKVIGVYYSIDNYLISYFSFNSDFDFHVLFPILLFII